MVSRLNWKPLLVCMLCCADSMAALENFLPEETQGHAAVRPRLISTFKDCNVCPEMVWLPPGQFRMGLSEAKALTGRSATPVHLVHIRYKLAVGAYAVTFDEWGACVRDGGCQSNREPGDENWGRGRRPVINVSWHQAKEYTAWLSRKTGSSYRLLSESEWEYAARAGTTTPFYTGQCINSSQANYLAKATNYKDCDAKKTYVGRTLPVGSFKSNAFGLYDMVGNVYQWTEDAWHENYENAPSNGAAWIEGGDQTQRAIRGNCWDCGQVGLLSAARNAFPAVHAGNIIGFRVARIE